MGTGEENPIYFAQCNHCNGSGSDPQDPEQECGLCDGEGQLYDYLEHLEEYYHHEQTKNSTQENITETTERSC